MNITKIINKSQGIKTILIFFTVFQLTLISLGSFAQDKNKINYRMDFGNRLFWRGVKYTESPIIQGLAGIEGKTFNFAVSGVYAFAPHEYHELNFIAEVFVTEQFKVGLVDYFGLTDSIKLEHDFFDFSNNTTKHMLDLYLNYKFKGRYPLELSCSTFLYGPDKNAKGKQRFSSYLEMTLPLKINQHTFSPFIGMALYAGFYSDKPAVVNAGFKFSTDFSVNTAISLPSEIAFILNPYEEKAYVSLCIGIQNK